MQLHDSTCILNNVIFSTTLPSVELTCKALYTYLYSIQFPLRYSMLTLSPCLCLVFQHTHTVCLAETEPC